MNRFSELGQLLENWNVITSSEFTRGGEIRQYSLTGTVGALNLAFALLVLALFLAISGYEIIKLRFPFKVSEGEAKTKKRKKRI